MSKTLMTWVLGVSATLALLLALGVGLSAVFADGTETEVSGDGEATAGSVTYTLAPGPCGDNGVVHSGTGPGSGALQSSTGNRFTFEFEASKENGVVEGKMKLIDHDLGLEIESDVTSLSVPHPTCGAPVGQAGLTASLSSSVGGVTLNGAAQPGWRFANSPSFEGGAGVGTVCFEVFNAENQKVRQWSAVLSAGEVEVEVESD